MKEKSISELIGALLLTAIIIGVLSVVLVLLVSHAPPQELPAADFSLKIDQPYHIETAHPEELPKIHIFHNRGESFNIFHGSGSDSSSDFYVKVDDVKWDIVRRSDDLDTGKFLLVKSNPMSEFGDYYSVGDELVGPYDYSSGIKPNNVQFIYKNKQGGEFLLWGTGDVREGSTSFIFSPMNPYTCNEVQFTDTSSIPATSWSWDFGDGSPIFSGNDPNVHKNPSHYYSSGPYTVTLTVSNGIDTWSKSRVITVSDLNADFSATPVRGPAPLTVQFNSLSKGDPDLYYWDFEGDDSYSPDLGPNPTHTYEYPGAYNVKHKVSKSINSLICESLPSDEPIVVFACTPVNGLDFSPITAYVNIPVLFRSSHNSDASTPISYRWTFSNDGSTSTSKNPTHTFTTAGTYTVTLETTNCDGIESVSKEITVYSSSCNYVITATAGTGGSISPSGVVPVTCGGSQTFTFTPDSGYEIDGIIVDGQSIGVVNSYTFTDVQEDHTIYVNFGNTGYCLIAGYITDETTGLGVPGIKVDVWNEDRTMILRSGISQSNGYYAIKHPKPKKSYWVDVNCPDQGNWRTNNPVSRWYNNVHLNPGRFCDATNINFSGRLYSNIVENVFIHGQRLSFSGDTIMGHGSTVIITGGLNTASTNLGAQIGATTIYIDGDVDLATGSAGLGSSTKPGNIYINGDLRLWNGQREIYGDVYVNGNFDLKDARIHGMVFVDGDLTLGWTPYLATDARIFYTGQIHYPNNYDQNILSKCIKWDKVPGFTIPDGLPSLKPDDWYSSNGYGTGGLLTSGMKVFADSYSSTGYRPSATNVIIVAKTGDITITGLGGSSLTGIFFAPYGIVTFGGGSLQGLILTRDGFFVTSGGTDVTFLPIHHYISNPSEYPFQ